MGYVDAEGLSNPPKSRHLREGISGSLTSKARGSQKSKLDEVRQSVSIPGDCNLVISGPTFKQNDAGEILTIRSSEKCAPPSGLLIFKMKKGAVKCYEK
jgi:hypothetical protein